MEAEDFLADIRANPRDDSKWRFFADWLEDNGEENCARFIHTYLELKTCDPSSDRAKVLRRGLLKDTMACHAELSFGYLRWLM